MNSKSILLTCLLALFSLTAWSQSPEEAEMMQKWQEAMTPGEEHQWLNNFAGEWAYTQTMYTAPDQPPMVSEGTGKSYMALGGRYLVDELSGTSMGMPFEGQNITAYDKLAGVYRSHWIDNFGTGFLISEGHRKDNVLEMVGTYPNFMGGVDTYRMVTTWINKNEYKMDMYMVDEDGNETLSMVLTYKRIK